MYTTRIKYAMDNFIVENYFLPMEGSYELKENSESGKSLLVLSIEGVNICVEEYDNKKNRFPCVYVGGLQPEYKHSYGSIPLLRRCHYCESGAVGTER